MKRAIFLAIAGLALLPLVGCGGGPGHFDNDPSCASEASRAAELRSDPYRDVSIDAPRGATAREIAANIGSDLVFEAGGDEILQMDGSPDALNGSAHGRMSQDMAEMMLRNAIEMQIDPRTGLPLYRITVSSPGGAPTVQANPMVNAERMKSQR